jgi:antitoxin component YwqK of YwqJK toxin-antitoxin module
VGTPLVYYPSGKIYEIDSIYGARNVDSPSWNGRITSFYENGKIQKVLQVKQGIIRGLAKIYDSNGMLIKEYFLTRDSIKNGPYTEFYPGGAIMTKANFENDTLNGMMYFFNEKGDTAKYYYRHKGNIVMPYKKWLDDGTILFGNYANKDETEILWCWYTKEGKIIKKKIQRIKDRGFVVPQ